MDDLILQMTLRPHRAMGAFGQRNALWVLMGFMLVIAWPIVRMGSVILFAFWFAPLPVMLWAFLAWNKKATLREELTITRDRLHLRRVDPNGKVHEFETDPYWVKIKRYDDGPVEDYVTLKNKEREVEIGAFLSPKERVTLYRTLIDAQAIVKVKPN